MQVAGEAQGLQYPAMQVPDEHDHRVVGVFDGLVRLDPQPFGERAVVAADAHEEGYERRDDDRGQPGALGELGHDNDERYDTGHDGADGVDDEAALPRRFAMGQVVAHHARLGEREPGEYPERVQRDQRA